jgi:hypothetical protein
LGCQLNVAFSIHPQSQLYGANNKGYGAKGNPGATFIEYLK